MYVRKKLNRSGTISVQVIEKNNGKYHVVKTVGSSADADTIETLYKQGLQEIENLLGLQTLNFTVEEEQVFLKTFYTGIQSIRLVGPELLLGKIFDSIGFNAIPDELFRHLTLTRLVYPVSKLKTVDYLFKYKGIHIEIDRVYRYLDHYHKNYIALVQQISYVHSRKVSGGQTTIVFYDVTTLYFEGEDEDDLRVPGFSKDGKHSNPQIVLGLLVNAEGFPLSYALFAGNKFEGHTMLPVIEEFTKTYQLGELIIVADSGLLSTKNVQELIQKKYRFILGARIKNEAETIKQHILDQPISEGRPVVIEKEQGQKLIITHSVQRAKKDAHNRERGLERLRKMVASGKLTKQQLSKRGYNRYLQITGNATIAINEILVEADSRWDGLKGYITNANLPTEEVITQYRQLWHIEKAFRISKTDLRIRPVFHHVKRRIEAHISIAFAACIVYKELERQLKLKKSSLSPEKVIDILKTIYDLTIITPYSKSEHTRLLVTTEEQAEVLTLFEIPVGCPSA
jgi:transposase